MKTGILITDQHIPMASVFVDSVEIDNFLCISLDLLAVKHLHLTEEDFNNRSGGVVNWVRAKEKIDVVFQVVNGEKAGQDFSLQVI